MVLLEVMIGVIVAPEVQDSTERHAVAGFKWVDYRLGDTVNGYMATQTARKVGWDHIEHQAIPGSIAAEYLNHTHKPNRFDVLCEIVRKRGEIHHDNRKALPNPADIVVHLRLGDTTDMLSAVSINKIWNAQTYQSVNEHKEYVFGRAYYEVAVDGLRRKAQNVTIVGWHHHGSLRNNQADKGVPRIERLNHSGSLIYRNFLIEWLEDQGFLVSHRWENEPDDDFVYMSHAQHFVYGGGGFSHMAGECVKRLGGKVHPDRAPMN